MRNWGSLKMDYFNKKGQSLTELATFGSILLLVLSFLISYGMRYNYQQDAQMRSFRMAMAEAYSNANRPDASASVVLVEDKHIPDPRDRFGAGSFVPAQAGAEVTWGNTLQNKHNVPNTVEEYILNLNKFNLDKAGPSPLVDLPRVKYNINGEIKEYTTAGYLYTTLLSSSDFYVEIPGSPRQKKNISEMKIYDPVPTEDLPDHPGTYLPATQVMVLLNSRETEVVSALAIREKGPLMPIIKVFPANGKHGDPVSSFVLLDPELGNIDPAYTQLNNDIDNDGTPDVTSANVQGLLPYNTEMTVTRNDSLKIEETPGATGQRKSTTSFNLDTTVKHKIKTNRSSTPTDVFTTNIIRGVTGKTWETPK